MAKFKVGEIVKILNNHSFLKGALVDNCYKIIERDDDWYLLLISEGITPSTNGKGKGWWFEKDQIERVVGQQLEFSFMYDA